MSVRPFKSKAQLRLCYSRKYWGMNGKWDCDKALKATPDVACLPERVGYPSKVKCRKQRVGEPVIGKIMTGPRQGRFFIVDGVKIYLGNKPKN